MPLSPAVSPQRRRTRMRPVLAGVVTCTFTLVIVPQSAARPLADEYAHQVDPPRSYANTETPRSRARRASRQLLHGLGPPVLGLLVDAFPVKGAVLVKRPPRHGQMHRFVALTGPSQLPVGAEFDTTRGAVRLTTARARGATFQSGVF